MTGKLIAFVVLIMSLFVYAIENVVFGGEYYSVIAVITAVLAVMPYLASHGNRQVVTKEIQIITIMTLLSFAVFYFADSATYLRPFTAFTIAAGAYFGVPVGYLCGVASLMLYSGVTHTDPAITIQLLLIGFIGLMAGMLRGKITENKLFALLFTFISSMLFSCSGILNLLWDAEKGFMLSDYHILILDSLVWFAVYAVSDVLLYFVIRFILGKKSERMKIRYEIFEYGYKV